MQITKQTECITIAMFGRMVSKSMNWFYVVICSFVYKFAAPDSFAETLNKTKFTLRFRPIHYMKRCYFETTISHAVNVGCRLYGRVSILALPQHDNVCLRLYRRVSILALPNPITPTESFAAPSNHVTIL